MTISKKRLYIIVMSIVAGLAIIAGTTTAIIVTRPNSNAMTGVTSTNDESKQSYYIGNLLTSSGGINTTTYNNLIEKVGALNYNGKKNAYEMSSTPIVFQMGTHATSGKPIYWQVVYRTDDIITVWMTQPYSTAVYNSSGTYTAYASSNLRTTVTNLYNTLKSNYTILNLTTANGIVVTPSTMQNTTGENWQTTQTGTKYSSSATSTNDSLSGAALNDAFWIPSFYEVHLCTSQYDSETYPGDADGRGLWALKNSDRGNTYRFDGTTSGIYCWLRSGSL